MAGGELQLHRVAPAVLAEDRTRALFLRALDAQSWPRALHLARQRPGLVSEPHRSDGSGGTLLHLLVDTGAVAALAEVLRWRRFPKDPLPVNLEGSIQPFTSGGTPLRAAAEQGRAECIRLLSEAGADLNVRADDLNTPLIAAAMRDKPASIRALAAAGADLNATRTNMPVTALSAAVFKGHDECMFVLLEAGASPDLPPTASNELSPLNSAIRSGHMQVARALVTAGADVRRRGILAAELRGRPRAARLPVRRHLVGLVDNPLAGALDGGHLELATLLVERGASVTDNVGEKDSAMPPLLWFVIHGNHAAVKFLLRHGAPAEEPAEGLEDGHPYFGKCALVVAATEGDDAMRHLFEKHPAEEEHPHKDSKYSKLRVKYKELQAKSAQQEARIAALNQELARLQALLKQSDPAPGNCSSSTAAHSAGSDAGALSDAASEPPSTPKSAQQQTAPLSPTSPPAPPPAAASERAESSPERAESSAASAPAASPAAAAAACACAACGGLDTKALRKCKGCWAVSYCSRACQRGHWPQHKPACRGAPVDQLLQPEACTYVGLLLSTWAVKARTH